MQIRGIKSKGLCAVPRGVWIIGLVSMFMDVSSEMIHSLLPVFLTSTLGASVALIGLIEGVAEATASITKLFSGWLSDWLGRRKLLAVVGYSLGALSKPFFPFAATPLDVFGARFVDRVGKGIRGAPRDALVADIAPPDIRGAAFGLRQSLDTIGAFAGPILAIVLMIALGGNIRAVFAWAIIPAVIAVALLVFGIKEPDDPTQKESTARPPIRVSDVRAMGTRYWSIVGLGVIFSMARFSEAFLVLRAQQVGLTVALVPLVIVVMNVVYAAVSAPAGSLADRADRRTILAIGLFYLVVADAVLALTNGVVGMLIGVALWGVHMGLTQGLLSAMIADSAPPQLRGTAFGIFNLAGGITLLAASLLAGQLWKYFGSQATFLAGGGFALLAVVALCFRFRLHDVRM